MHRIALILILIASVGSASAAELVTEFKGEGKWVVTHYHVKPEGEQIHMRFTYTRRK